MEAASAAEQWWRSGEESDAVREDGLWHGSLVAQRFCTSQKRVTPINQRTLYKIPTKRSPEREPNSQALLYFHDRWKWFPANYSHTFNFIQGIFFNSRWSRWITLGMNDHVCMTFTRPYLP